MDPETVILVDLNVILDVLQQRQPFYDESAQVLDAAGQEEISGLIAAHSITTLFYVTDRVRSRRLAVSAIMELLTVFSIASVNEAVIRQALTWGWRDFEDAVQMAAAAASGADFVVTRNPKDFETQAVPVLRPGELLAVLAR